VLAVFVGLYTVDHDLFARGVDKRDRCGAVALIGVHEVPERIAGIHIGHVDDALLFQIGFFAGSVLGIADRVSGVLVEPDYAGRRRRQRRRGLGCHKRDSQRKHRQNSGQADAQTFAARAGAAPGFCGGGC